MEENLDFPAISLENVGKRYLANNQQLAIIDVVVRYYPISQNNMSDFQTSLDAIW